MKKQTTNQSQASTVSTQVRHWGKKFCYYSSAYKDQAVRQQAVSHPSGKDIIINQEWKNDHFNVITDNEALAVEIELQNGDKVILATIYCPNGNSSLRLFRMVNALSKQVMFLRDRL